MRAILAGGGTGGHVIPALAIAQELQKRYGAEVLFIGTARGIENRLVPAAGFPLATGQGRRAEQGQSENAAEDAVRSSPRGIGMRAACSPNFIPMW